MLRKLSIILALGSALAIPSAAMARGGGCGGGGFHGGGFHGGFHGGGFGGGFHGGGLGGFHGGDLGGFHGPVLLAAMATAVTAVTVAMAVGDWGADWWPYYDYGDYYATPVTAIPIITAPRWESDNLLCQTPPLRLEMP